MKYYDTVKRIVRGKGGRAHKTYICRMRCVVCGSVLRALPNNVFPYKQYDGEIIMGVVEGFITPSTLGFEDYPCEATMRRWIGEFGKQLN